MTFASCNSCLASPAAAAEATHPNKHNTKLEHSLEHTPHFATFSGGQSLAVSRSTSRDARLGASWQTLLLLVFYCALVALSSWLGGALPSVVHLTHTRMQLMISLIGGLMLGIGVFHMLPHSLARLAEQGASSDQAMLWMMAGMVTMFFLLRAFHFHHHGPSDFAELPQIPLAHDHDHDHGDGHAHQHHAHHATARGGLSWMGVFVGLAVHSLIDGLALGASVQAEAAHSGEFRIVGVGTFLAVLLHKPLDSVSIGWLMTVGHWPQRTRQLVNVVFALICPLGALLFALGVNLAGDSQNWLLANALAYSAGVFICLALSDLLPEMEFHSHHKLQLSLALFAGIALAWGIGYLEPEHVHGPSSQIQRDVLLPDPPSSR